MSNPARFEVDETSSRLDAAAARRQFSLSLGVGLAILLVAAMIGLQPTRAASGGTSARHGEVSAPQFAPDPTALALLRQAMTAGAEASAN